MVRFRMIDVDPQTMSSSISTIGGHVAATSTFAPELDLSYFFTPHFAVEGIAASTKHTISAQDTAAGNVRVGNTWVLPPAVTAQWHFLPNSPVNPYVGAGVNYTFFYATNPQGTPVTHLALSNNFGEVVQAGVDMEIAPRWYVNADIKQIFLNTTAKLTALGLPIKAKTALDPTVFGLGIGYKF